MAYIENNPTSLKNSKAYGGVEIVRIAPFNCGTEIEYKMNNSSASSTIAVTEGKNKQQKAVYTKLVISELETGKVVYEETKYYCYSDLTYRATRLLNDVDYVAEVYAYDRERNEVGRSVARLVRCGYFFGKVIDYIHPCDEALMESGEFVGSPHIVKLNNGVYVASHDVFCHLNEMGYGSLCKFFISQDYGKSWKYISKIDRCTWGTMFLHNDVLYIVGTYDLNKWDLVLYYSTDCANTWSEPVVLCESEEEKLYRATPTAYAVHNNRIWIEHGRQDNGRNGIAVISACLDDDLTKAESWTDSEPLFYNQEWENAAPEWSGNMLEEGNVLVTPGGELKIIERCNSMRYDAPVLDPDKVRMYYLTVDKDKPEAAPVFEKAALFSAAMHKFYIQYDKNEERYLALGNRLTTSQMWQRNVLTLYSSTDLESWKIERDLINLEDIEWHETAWEAGYQYPSFMIEGNDIVAVVRTALNGADNFHNSNAMTFHRFKDINDKYNK